MCKPQVLPAGTEHTRKTAAKGGEQMSEKEKPSGKDPSREEIRKQIDSILSRARADEAFGRQLNSDPEKALRES
jgi:hypothetical protein